MKNNSETIGSQRSERPLKWIAIGVALAIVVVGVVITGVSKSQKARSNELLQQGLTAYAEEEYFEAVKWFRKSAEQGNAEAQCRLGLCYYYGHGVPEDFAKAVKWFSKAVDQGDVEAQCYLGLCYLSGYGVPVDFADAVKWFSKAANQGHAGAQYMLGLCYFNGCGIPKDESEAKKWFSKASEQGYELAKKALEEMDKKGTAGQEPSVPKNHDDKRNFIQRTAGNFTHSDGSSDFVC